MAVGVAPRLGAFYFAYFCYIGASSAYFALWLADRGYTATQISLVLALPQFLRIFAPAAWGWAADRSGARRGIVIASCAACCACFIGLAFVQTYHGVLLAVGLMAMFSAGVLPLVEATTLAALAGRPGSYGPVRLWGSLGFIASVLGVGALLDAWPVSLLVALIAALMAVAFIASLFMPVVPATRATAATEQRLWSLLAQSRVAAFFAACFCMNAAHGALYAFYSLYLVQAGYSKTLVGLMWTLGVAAEIGVFLVLPWLFRRFSYRAVLLASFIAAAVRFVAIGWGVESLLVLGAAQLLHAMTFGTYHAASVAMVHRLFSGRLEVRGQALYASLSYGLGGTAGMLMAGWLWQGWGPEVTFAASSVAGLVGACLIAYMPRERAP